MHEDPDDAENGDQHIETIAATLPITSRTQRRHLQQHLRDTATRMHNKYIKYERVRKSVSTGKKAK